jgi:hypothetical protein
MRMARVALLGAAFALTLAGASAASDDAEIEKFSWNKLFDYTGCISAIAMADTPSGVSSATGICGRMIVNWWNE